MIVEFHDQKGQRLHDKFQDWRREHQIQQGACFLSFAGKNNAQLHAVADCWHIGDANWDGHRAKGSKEKVFSLTKNRKVCADSPDELLLWAAEEGVTVKYCRCFEEMPIITPVTPHSPVESSPSQSDDNVLPVAASEIAIREESQNAPLPIPMGNRNPQATTSEVTQRQRDDLVKAWVLQQANGMCESCEKPSPFNKSDGLPYLEGHHVLHMTDGGSDTPTNVVALCPNCHRELHYGVNAKTMVTRLYERVARLVRE